MRYVRLSGEQLNKMNKEGIIENALDTIWEHRGRYYNNVHNIISLFHPDATKDEHNYYVRLYYQVSNSPQEYYRKAFLPKQNGGMRELNVPGGELKNIQRRILRELLGNVKLSEHAVAYRKGKNVKDAARVHVGKRLVVKLDIKDFFDSITFRHVTQRVFTRDRFSEKVAVLLANFCCYENKLPQGAPTSPVISNLVMKEFDDYMAEYCRGNNIAYTRYCDDCMFSGDQFDPDALINTAKKKLWEMGFSINREKTKLINKGQRQSVTGVVVNEKMQVPAAYRKKIRQEIYYIEKFGLTEHIKRSEKGRYAILNDDEWFVDRIGYLNHLIGKIRHVVNINPYDGKMEQCLRKIIALRRNYTRN